MQLETQKISLSNKPGAGKHTYAALLRGAHGVLRKESGAAVKDLPNMRLNVRRKGEGGNCGRKLRMKGRREKGCLGMKS